MVGKVERKHELRSFGLLSYYLDGMEGMDDYALIMALEKRIHQVYAEQGLKSLRFGAGENQSFAPLGVDLFGKYYGTVVQDETVEVGEDEEVEYFYSQALFTDLISLSDQAIYYTAYLYVLAPLINNPLDRPVYIPGYPGVMYFNEQNPPAKRFDSISDTLAEKTYAFWGRLGTLLNRYLAKPLAPHRVDFSRVMDCIEQQMGAYHGNAGYQWLKAFKDNEQKELNEQRRLIVHHQTSGTAFHNKHIEAVLDRNAMEAIMNERFQRPDFFKAYHKLSMEALEKSLDLIAMLPAPPPPKVVKKKTTA